MLSHAQDQPNSHHHSGLISLRIDWFDLCHLHFAIISKPSIEVIIEQ